MSRMFDTFRPDIVDKHIKEIVTDGYSAIGVYIFESSGFKRKLTRQEAIDISAAGLSLVTILENGTPTAASYFTPDKGNHDAHLAYSGAIDAGQKSGAIYFTIDYDASEDDLTKNIIPYFQRIKEVFKALSSPFLIGAYGNGISLMKLKSLGLIDKEWLSQSKGFQGYQERLTKKPLPNIIQGPEGTLLGMDIDTDTTDGDAGGWQLKVGESAPTIALKGPDERPILDRVSPIQVKQVDKEVLPEEVEVINGINPSTLSDQEIQYFIAKWQQESKDALAEGEGDGANIIEDCAIKLEEWFSANRNQKTEEGIFEEAISRAPNPYMELPESVDLSESLPPIVDQGEINSSTAIVATTAAIANGNPHSAIPNWLRIFRR